jgi:hypothetical protein
MPPRFLTDEHGVGTDLRAQAAKWWPCSIRGADAVRASVVTHVYELGSYRRLLASRFIAEHFVVLIARGLSDSRRIGTSRRVLTVRADRQQGDHNDRFQASLSFSEVTCHTASATRGLAAFAARERSSELAPAGILLARTESLT